MNTIDLSSARWRKSRHSNGSGNCVEAATVWRKSRYSNGSGECVEAATVWRKSRYSNHQGECVEAATVHHGQRIAIRDSKNPAGPALVVLPEAWRSLTSRIKAGELG